MEEAPVEPRGPKIGLRADYRGGVEVKSNIFHRSGLRSGHGCRAGRGFGANLAHSVWTRSGPGVDLVWAGVDPKIYIKNLVNKILAIYVVRFLAATSI
jgi:hypothetical protein